MKRRSQSRPNEPETSTGKDRRQAAALTPPQGTRPKNWLFAGSDAGGERAALFYSLIVTCRLNGIDLSAYFRDVMARIADHPINKIDALMPWKWAAQKAEAEPAASTS